MYNIFLLVDKTKIIRPGNQGGSENSINVLSLDFVPNWILLFLIACVLVLIVVGVVEKYKEKTSSSKVN